MTSDAAKAIIAHTEVQGAHHSPDLFHVQHDTVQATGFALASRTRATVAELEKAQRHTAAMREHHEASCDESRHTATMTQNPLSPMLEQHLPMAEAAENAARQQVRA